jgi:hypothetical protein
MTLEEFERTTSATTPPEEVSDLLKALWWEKKGDWSKAHAIAQDIQSSAAAWVHAYLHRREGDLSNAGYWYRQAGKPVKRGDLEAEWQEIVTALLGRS